MIKIPKVKCRRCGHKWTPNGLEKPLRCANKKCRSPYWETKATVRKPLEKSE